MCLDITSYLLGKKSGGGGKKPELQEKSITITQNGETIVTPDEGKDGLSKVNITTNVSGETSNNVLVDTKLSYDTTYDLGIRALIKTIDPLDTSNMTNMSNMFNGCNHLVSIPQLNTSKVNNMKNMFSRCMAITTIPLLDTSNVTNMNNMFGGCTQLTSIPQLNTSKVNNMSGMFSNCEYLTTIPLLDTSNVTNMSNMFITSPKLSNESLNNILQMCINAVKIASSNKTLKYIGLSSTQATTCQGLSNYQAFLDAGWTKGY